MEELQWSPCEEKKASSCPKGAPYALGGQCLLSNRHSTANAIALAQN